MKVAASVEIRLRERECIPDQFHSWFCIIGNHDFHDIESKKNVGIIEHS